MDREYLSLFAAIADRILPGRHAEPGASEAGVVHFLEALSKRPDFKVDESMLQSGFRLIQDISRCLHDKEFLDCSAEEKDTVLQQLERVPHPTIRLFFSLMVRWTLAGFFCHPRHGGNLEARSWRYLNLDFPLEPSARSR